MLPGPSRAAQVEAPAAPAQPGDADKAASADKDAARSAEPGKMTPAMATWVRQVHGVVIKATNGIARRLALGTYRVGFTVDEHGRGSNYGAEGADPKQASVITSALISRSFPVPPDRASHAVSFILRNGSPTAKPPAVAGPPVGDKPPADGSKP